MTRGISSVYQIYKDDILAEMKRLVILLIESKIRNAKGKVFMIESRKFYRFLKKNLHLVENPKIMDVANDGFLKKIFWDNVLNYLEENGIEYRVHKIREVRGRRMKTKILVFLA